MFRRLGPVLAISTCLPLGSFPSVTEGQVAPSRPAASAAKPAATASTTTTDAKAKWLADAFAANPITAPYEIKVDQRKGRYVLKGRVGSTEIHDEALRVAMNSRLPITDELVTDQRYIERSLMYSDGTTPMFTTSPVASSYSWLYPEPLFGRVDEPFAGMDPPAISYAPDWPYINQRRPLQASQAIPRPGYTLPPNTVEMSIDPRGVALLRGNVPTAADKITVGQQLAQVPGVVGVINELDTTGPAPRRTPNLSDTPPPPPTPAFTQPRTREPAPPAPPIQVEPGTRVPNPLERRATQALERVSTLRGVALRVRGIEGGVVALSGKVAGAREAMQAYRAVQTTPGVTAVVDTLEFAPPEENRRNPLTYDVDSSDVEPYLLAQMSRNLGDLAHVDRVTVSGSSLEIKASLDRDDNRPRAEAVLRSMPLLRGFQIKADFKTLR